MEGLKWNLGVPGLIQFHHPLPDISAIVGRAKHEHALKLSELGIPGILL